MEDISWINLLLAFIAIPNIILILALFHYYYFSNSDENATKATDSLHPMSPSPGEYISAGGVLYKIDTIKNNKDS